LAIDASTSGVDVQMSRRPSPSKSCAYARKLDGMNCGWPSAPAQDPFIAGSSTSPLSRMASALNSSSRNIAPRRGSYASVASVEMVGRTPLKRPKLDSSPQTATMTPGGTPYLALTRLSSAACCFAIARAVRTIFGVSRRCRYLSKVSTSSACVRSRSMTVGTGSRPVSARSSVASLMPRWSASVRRADSQSANGISGGSWTTGSCGVCRATKRPRTAAGRRISFYYAADRRAG
jgi:hypothetical protein